MNVDIMERTKETAVTDYLSYVRRTWTWKKLTEEERTLFRNALETEAEKGIIKGTYTARWNCLQSMYTMFLIGCGYSGGDWRN